MRQCRLAKGSVAVLLLLLVLLAAGATPTHALDTLYVIRHAEKQSDWPEQRELAALQPLSDQGMRTAARFASRLESVRLVAVYASPTTRTLHTGLFTAQAHACALVADERTVDRGAIGAWIDALKAEHPGPGAVLVVGHSNTVPWFFEAMGAQETCDEVLGVTEQSYGRATEGYDSYWEIDLNAHGCESIVRHRIEP